VLVLYELTTRRGLRLPCLSIAENEVEGSVERNTDNPSPYTAEEDVPVISMIAHQIRKVSPMRTAKKR